MKATIIHHQGFGDLFTSNALCNYYAEKYDELIVFVSDESRKKVVDYMYRHVTNIKCVIPRLHNIYNGKDGCINCHTPGNPNSCPRGGVCKFIDYSDYNEYDNIKIGCFSGNYEAWDKLLAVNRGNGISFSHTFYQHAGIDLKERVNKFSIYRDKQLENLNYKNIEYKDYVVVHDDANRGMKINLDTDLDIYNLNGVSEIMLDQIKILENAKEIHLIDSSYSVLVYFLSFTNDKIRKIPKYLHKYIMGQRDLLIYENEKPENWIDLN